MPFSYTNEMSMHMDFDNHEQNITLRCRVRNDKDIFQTVLNKRLTKQELPLRQSRGK